MSSITDKINDAKKALDNAMRDRRFKKERMAREKRAEYVAITDEEAVNAFEYLSKTEGIIPAIESSHAIAYAMKYVPTLDKDKIVVVNVSGRGDKDVAAIAIYRGVQIYE